MTLMKLPNYPIHNADNALPIEVNFRLCSFINASI